MRTNPSDTRSAHDDLDAKLDEALTHTFPASDPVALTLPRPAAAESASTGRRLDYDAVAPEGLAAFRHFAAYVRRSGLEPQLLELVRIRASQLNNCAYCIDMHTKDARAAGESEQRLYALSAWRETPFYSDRERAALAWTEALTRIADGLVPDALYREARRHFSEKELVDLSLAIIAINGWNRLCIPFRTPPGSYRPRARPG